MRTTITLDEDVAARLEEEVRRNGGTFKDTVNRVLRAGLEAVRRKPAGKRFVVRPRALSPGPGVDLDNIGEVLEQAEGPRHR